MTAPHPPTPAAGAGRDAAAGRLAEAVEATLDCVSCGSTGHEAGWTTDPDGTRRLALRACYCRERLTAALAAYRATPADAPGGAEEETR